MICAEWWSASGPFHGWLKRYKEHLVEQTPHREETDDVGAGFMVIMISTPATTYRSTATLDAIDEHMGKAAQVFTRRRQWPKQLME